MHEANDLYKRVIDTLYDGIYFVNGERRITFWTNGTEALTGYAAAEAVGHECRSIFCHVDELGKGLCGDRCPIAQTLADGRTRETELYFHHREGHLVPASLRVAPVKDSDGELVVAVEMCSDSSPRYEVRQRLEQLQKQALYDPLTGLANRRCVDIKLLSRLEEMNRYGWPFGVLFIDIDHFKRINDSFGHDIGDKVLVMVARTLLNTLRPFDILGRWGGEEFVAVVANVDEKKLASIADRLRLLVEQSSFTLRDETIAVTVSIGATLAREGDSIGSLLKRADRLMFQSKKAGRNRITL